MSDDEFQECETGGANGSFLSPAEVDDNEPEIKISKIKCNMANMFEEECADLMQVYLRVRPFTNDEISSKEKEITMTIEENTLTTHAPKDSHSYKNSIHGTTKQHNKFTFTRILDEKTSQKAFFDQTVFETVKNFVNGENCLIFTYGVTNSGKTYTIQGLPQDGGILPRTLDVVFNSIKDKHWEDMSFKPVMFNDVSHLNDHNLALEEKIKQKVLRMAQDSIDYEMPSVLDSETSRSTVNSTIMSEDSLMSGKASMESLEEDPLVAIESEVEQRNRETAIIDVQDQGKIRFSIWVSFCEIYNEQIHDLLEPLPKKKNAKRQVLQLREDKNGSPYVRGLKEIKVSSADEAYKILAIGKANLQMACTKLNHNSSRSHCIFRITMLRVVDGVKPTVARISQLSFCDLAGAERQAKTGTQGQRVKEAGNINTSLLALGRCIKTLRRNQAANKNNQMIVPFRDSKLTRLFQSFFIGRGRACMIVNVNQNASCFDETLHALKYSAVAKHVVVTQEPVKEKKKPDSDVSKKFSLSQAYGNGRETIAWADPEEIIEEEDVMMEENEEEEEAEATDNVQYISVEREKVLIDMINRLKDRLKSTIREKKDLLAQNANIRQQTRIEVCEEMASQLVDIEYQHAERRKQEVEAVEDLAEWRLQMLQDTIKINRKRKRLNPDDEDSSLEISQLNNKIEKLEEVLNEQRASIRETLKEKESLQKQVSQLNFELSDLRQKYANKSMSGDEVGHAEVVEMLQNQLKEARAELAEQSEELKEMSEMVTEAGETFTTKEKEIETMKQIITDAEKKIKEQVQSQGDLEATIKESQDAMKKADSKLKNYEDKIAMLEKQLKESPKQRDCHEKKFENQIKEIEKLALDLDYEKKQAEMKETELFQIHETLQEKISTEENFKKEIHVLQEKINSLEKSLHLAKSNLEKADTASVKNSSVMRKLNDENLQLTAELTSKDKALLKSEASIKQVKEDIEVLNKKAEENKNVIDEHSKCPGRIAHLQEQLDDYILKVNEQAEEIGVLKESISASKKVKKRFSLLEKNVSDKDDTISNLKADFREKEDGFTKKISELKLKNADFDKLISVKENALEELKSLHKEREKELKDSIEAKEEELKKCKDNLSDIRTELENLKQKESESSSKSEATKIDINEDLEASLRKKIRELEGRTNEAEYTAQMTSRQIRREKSQVERKLKESEEDVLKAHREINKLRQQVRELKETAEESIEDSMEDSNEEASQLRKKLEEESFRISNLEGIIRELEKCLKSAKSGQDIAEEKAEGYRKKVWELEEKLADQEDCEQPLRTELQEAKKDKMETVERYRQEVSELNQEVSNLEHKCKEYIAELDSLEAKLADLSDLESKLKVVEQENDSLKSDYENMKKNTDSQQLLDNKLKELEQEHDSLKINYETIMKDNESKCKLQAQLKDIGKEYDSLKSDYEKVKKAAKLLEEKLTDAEEKNDLLKSGNEKMKRDVESQTMLQKQLKALEDENDSLKSDYDKIKGEAESNKMNLKDMQHKYDSMKCDYENIMKDNESKNSLEMKLKKIEGQNEQLKEDADNMHVLEVKLRDMENKYVSLKKDYGEIKKDYELMQKKESKLKDEYESLKSNFEKVNKDAESKYSLEVRLKKIEDEYKSMKTKYEEVKKNAESKHSLEVKLRDLEIEHYNIKCNFESVEKDAKAKVAFETKLKVIEHEYESLKIDHEMLKKDAESHRSLKRDIDQFKREADLKREYQIKLEDLQVEHRSLKRDYENVQKEAQLKQDIQTNLKDLQKEYMSLQMECKRAKKEARIQHETQEKLDALQIEFQAVKQNAKIALKDATAKERLMEDLKEVVSEQEKAMEAQDSVLINREVEINELRDENQKLLKDLSLKCKEFDTARAESMAAKQEAAERDLQLSLLQTKHSSVKEDLQRLQSQKDNREKEVMAAANRDTLDKEQKIALLKTKFQALEDETQRLRGDKEKMKKEAVEAEARKKEELQKWRDERDKLVGQLQGILKEQQQEIASLKQQKKVKAEPNSSEMENLRQMVQDRDNTIAQLSLHLDQPRRRTRKMVKDGGGSDDNLTSVVEELKKDMEITYKKLEEERISHKDELHRVSKAKDVIIAELKNSNQQLQRQTMALEKPSYTQLTEATPKRSRKTRGHSEMEEEGHISELKETAPSASKRSRRTRGHKDVDEELPALTPSNNTRSRRTRGQKEEESVVSPKQEPCPPSGKRSSKRRRHKSDQENIDDTAPTRSSKTRDRRTRNHTKNAQLQTLI